MSVYNTGSLFSSDNLTWVGHHNEEKEQQYTKQPNDIVPDQKFHIEVYEFFSSLNSVTTFSTDTESFHSLCRKY